MEAIHKELFGEDDLEVAVRMQSGKFIGPIEERYLYYYYKSSRLSKTIIRVTHDSSKNIKWRKITLIFQHKKTRPKRNDFSNHFQTSKISSKYMYEN